jgi:hypothetical protein
MNCLVAFLLTISLCVSAQGADFQATTGRASSRIQVGKEKGKTIIDVRSDSGIDKATIKRLKDTWPMSIVVRLHLKGLESFRAGSGKVVVEWSVSSNGQNASRVSLRQGNDELALDKKSPFFTSVRIVGGNGKIPLKGGYFEVPLPAKLTAGNPRELTLRWIDFYRN